MRARYAGALLAATLIAAIAAGQTSSRARVSTAPGAGSGTVSTATAPLVITGADIAMPPASASQSGYLNNVAGFLIVDAGFRVNTAGGEGIEVTGSTGNNNLLKNGNANYTGIVQTDTGQSLTIYSNSFPALKVGVGAAGVSTPYSITAGTGAAITTAGSGASTVGIDVHNTDTTGFGGIQYNDSANTLAVFSGFGNSASSAPAEFRFNNVATGGTIAFKIGSVDALKVTNGLKIVSGTEYVAFSVSPNSLLAATALGGAIVGPQAFTVTGISPFVATQAVTTAATLIFTITDGTNTCTGTFTCDGTGIASLQGTGPKRVTTANGAGTGCVYAASAALTLSVSTQGCGTAPIVNNINVVGKWQ